MFFKRIWNSLFPSSHKKYPLTPSYSTDFTSQFDKFKQILEGNTQVLEIMAEMEEKLSGEYIFDMKYLKESVEVLSSLVHKIIYNLNILANNKYIKLFETYEKMRNTLAEILAGKDADASGVLALLLSEIERDQEELVGGKSSNLGEISNRIGLLTPKGFVITTAAFRQFMEFNKLEEKLAALFKKDAKSNTVFVDKTLQNEISTLFEQASLPQEIEKAINAGVKALQKKQIKKVHLAVRSSAFGEDKMMQSYAGQFTTLLNQPVNQLKEAYKKVLASRFCGSILSYGNELVFKTDYLPMAVSFQEMINAQVSGVIYTLDPRSNSINHLVITAIPGLGLELVSGAQDADYYEVSRFHPFKVLKQNIAAKKSKMILAADTNLRSR